MKPYKKVLWSLKGHYYYISRNQKFFSFFLLLSSLYLLYMTDCIVGQYRAFKKRPPCIHIGYLKYTHTVPIFRFQNKEHTCLIRTLMLQSIFRLLSYRSLDKLCKWCSEESVMMRAPESSSDHVNTSPSSSPETGLERAHPRPPGPGRKWEEEGEEEEEVAGSQRETEWGEIGRGHGTSGKIKDQGYAPPPPK